MKPKHVVTYTYNPRFWETEAERLRDKSQEASKLNEGKPETPECYKYWIRGIQVECPWKTQDNQSKVIFQFQDVSCCYLRSNYHNVIWLHYTASLFSLTCPHLPSFICSYRNVCLIKITLLC